LWYGRPGNCGVFIVLAVVLAICVCMDLAVTLFLSTQGTIHFSNSTKGRCMINLFPECLQCHSSHKPDVAAHIFIMWHRLPRKSEFACRYLMALHITALICELGVVVITLLSLFSTLNMPDSSHGQQQSLHVQRQVATTLVSLVTTILAFALTLIGAGKLLDASKHTLMRVRDWSTSIPDMSRRISRAPCTESVSIGKSRPGEV
jgi:hypothetical protein